MKNKFIAFALVLALLVGSGSIYKANVKSAAKVQIQNVAEQDPWGPGCVAPVNQIAEQDPWGPGSPIKA